MKEYVRQSQKVYRKNTLNITRAGVYLKPALVQVAHAAVISTENKIKFCRVEIKSKDKVLSDG